MHSNEDRVMEAQLKKAVWRAFKKLSEEIVSEPTTLVIESDNTQADASDETAAEIMAWLFNRG